MTRRRLLYCSPVLPALSGNGLAMRAGTVLRALATRYRVSLLVVPVYQSPADQLPDEIAVCCAQVVVANGPTSIPAPASTDSVSAGRFGSLLSGRWRRHQLPATPLFHDEPFDVVHVFRLALVDHVQAWLATADARTERHLDLDDVESVSHRRIADLYMQTGQTDLAVAERIAADSAAAAECEALRAFDRVYVCSEVDRQRLDSRRRDDGRAQVSVLPNALPVPLALADPPAGEPFTFLFVGTLGYVPNEDGIVTFCRDMLPRLRRMAPLPFQVLIAGSGATPTVHALDAIPEVTVLGAVDDISAWYAVAHAVIVPIRAGGGTRIKLLEAFAFHRPVVTTTIGAEGIDARPDQHLLIGDDASTFARQCARLIASPGLGSRLAEAAHALFLERYSSEALTRLVAALP
jgi:glycosyltransferase involved in cell wall biosynthesis